MRVLFHCHASPVTGAGHLVRCLALAERARARGHEVVLIGDLARSPLLVGSALSQDFEVVVTHTRDAGATQRSVSSIDPDLVHLDFYEPYSLDGNWAVSNMQDGEFGARPADVVVDPTPGADDRAAPAARSSCLLGLRYAPIRSSISQRRGAWRPQEQPRVLVTLGSSDPTGLVTNALEILGRANLDTDVTVLGHAGFDAPPGLKAVLHPPTRDFADLVLDHELVISASGTTVAELACLGVPMALVAAVANQQPAYNHLVGIGAALGLGVAGQWRTEAANDLRTLWQRPNGLQTLGAHGPQMVDGEGTDRIVAAWESLMASASHSDPIERVNIRPATLEDSDDLMSWRNDWVTRANSRDQNLVVGEVHEGWLRGALVRTDTMLFVAEQDGLTVGTVRWDARRDGVWEVSITVAPDARGRGIGAELLVLGERALSEAHVTATFFSAVVHRDNDKSTRLFLNAGYERDSPPDNDGFIRYRKYARAKSDPR